MFLVLTRNFPPEVGGMQNLMWGLTTSLSKLDMVKVFADYHENSKIFDEKVSFSIERVKGPKIIRKFRKSFLINDFLTKNKKVRCIIADHWKSLENIKTEVKKICLIHSKEINHKKGSWLNKRVLNILNNVDYVIANSNFTKNLAIELGVESEKIIKEFLTANSKFPILAEESGANKDLGKSFWVVDPLDGTSNYSRNFPMCCISIALIYEDEIVLGVINDFNQNALYEGTINSSAKLNGLEINVSSIDNQSNATLATGFPAKGKFDEDFMIELSNELVRWKKVRMIGSAAMSCAFVASGQFDQYQEKGIYLWDIAAGLCIIKAAGGSYSYKPYRDDQFKVDVIANNNCL